jgi:uncharacterized protein (DUF2147 family)
MLMRCKWTGRSAAASKSDGPARARAARSLGFAALLFVLGSLSARAQGAQGATPPPGGSDVTGVWIDHTGRGAVEVRPCGGRICGYVVWMQQPNDARGRPLTDGLNPDLAKRNTPICGLQIIGNLARGGRGYEGGWIYNPEDGGRFDVDIRLAAGNQLIVHGYAGIRLLGETFTWTRAPEGLPRCRI